MRKDTDDAIRDLTNRLQQSEAVAHGSSRASSEDGHRPTVRMRTSDHELPRAPPRRDAARSSAGNEQASFERDARERA